MSNSFLGQSFAINGMAVQELAKTGQRYLGNPRPRAKLSLFKNNVLGGTGQGHKGGRRTVITIPFGKMDTAPG